MGRGIDQKVGKYEVVDKVGEGGMGVVYKAKDPLLGRIVAIKKMTGDFAARPEWRDRFFTEAKVVASLNHPNIVTLYDVGIDGENPYIVMEFLDGQGLDRLLSSGQYMSAVQKIDYVIQVCNALQCAHSAKPNGIIHRDIKPANVIVLADLVHVKLVDFGIAKIGGGQSGHSTTGMAIGTSGYMSPQQLLAKKDIDGRTDVFSTGVMLYQLFAGVLPWDAGDAIATAMKILNEPYPPLDTYVGEYPRELDDVLARALAKDVDDRYASAEEMAWELAHVQERLKRGLVSEYVNEAKRAIERQDFRRAKDVLSDVLKLDTQNSEAREMMHELNQKMQKEVSSEKVKNLQTAAESAAARKQFTEALSSIEQAMKLDKSNSELMRIKDLIVADQKRYQDVRKKLNLAEAAQKMDDFQEALSLVDRALELDPTDTQARMMQAAIQKRMGDQTRTKQVKELADAARKEIQARQFTSAQDLISKLEQLDPAFAEINSLKKAATTGHEQEQRRKNLQQAASEVQQKLAVNDYGGALQMVVDSLRKYPNEPLLLELKSKAESLKQKAEQEHYIEEQVNQASRLLNDKRPSNALEIAEQLAARFPADARVHSLLERSRAEASKVRNDRRRSDLLQKAKQALEEDRPEAAIHVLETAIVEFPGAEDFEATLRIAQRRAAEQQNERSSIVSEIERWLAAGDIDKAISTIDSMTEGRNSPEIVKLRDIAVEQRKKAGALKKKLQGVEQQIKLGNFAGAQQGLAACRSEHGDDPRIEKVAEELQKAKTSSASQEVGEAIAKAESLIRKLDFKEAKVALEQISGELLLVPRELQTRFSNLREQIAQAERNARQSGPQQTRVEGAPDPNATRVAEFGKAPAPAPAPPPATDVLHFGSKGAAPAPAKEPVKEPEAPKAEPKQKTQKQKASTPAPADEKETVVKERPKTDRLKVDTPPPSKKIPTPAPAPAPAVARAVAEEPKSKMPMFLGIGAVVLVIAIAVGYFAMRPKTDAGTASTTNSGSVTPGGTTPDTNSGGNTTPAAPGNGVLAIDATPWANVTVTPKSGGDAKTGETPMFLSLPPGEYTVELKAANGKKQSKSVKINANETANVSASLGNVNVHDLVQAYTK